MRRLLLFALGSILASSVYALPVARPDAPGPAITPVAQGCGLGFQRVRGVCVRNTTVRRTRRAIRREVRRCTSGFAFVRGRCVRL